MNKSIDEEKMNINELSYEWKNEWIWEKMIEEIDKWRNRWRNLLKFIKEWMKGQMMNDENATAFCIFTHSQAWLTYQPAKAWLWTKLNARGRGRLVEGKNVEMGDNDCCNNHIPRNAWGRSKLRGVRKLKKKQKKKKNKKGKTRDALTTLKLAKQCK